MSKIRTRRFSAVAVFGVLPAAALLALTAPGAAHASGWLGQGQYGDQSNSTDQDSSAASRAVQIAPAANVNVGGGDQTIYQANRNGSRPASGNGNLTRQAQRQNQGGGQSNSTHQNSAARSDARQYAPAYNIGGSAQRIAQGNSNTSDATSGNVNVTGQDLAQNQGLPGLR